VSVQVSLHVSKRSWQKDSLSLIRRLLKSLRKTCVGNHTGFFVYYIK
jgi:hypothetical protein